MNLHTQPERTLIGIEMRASNQEPQAIGEVWQRFMTDQLANQIPGRSDGNLIAVYCEYEGDHTKPYTFFLGCTVANDAVTPEGFAKRTIRGGEYMKHVASGKMPDALMTAWSEIWNMKLNRNFEADFEIHDPSTPESVDLYIGLS